MNSPPLSNLRTQTYFRRSQNQVTAFAGYRNWGDSKADVSSVSPSSERSKKLPLETEPVARDDNTIFTFKHLVTKLSSRLTQRIIGSV